MTAAYGSDLAWVHDQGFGDVARESARFLIRELRRRGFRGGRVVELACGSGVSCAALCAAGFDVGGVDGSAAMIRRARQRAPRGRFVVASLLDCELLTGRRPAARSRSPERPVAVTVVGEGLGYALDGKGNGELRKLLRRVYAALEPGGIFLCDVATPGRGGRPRRPRTGFREGMDWTVLYTVEEDRAARRLTRRITCFRRDGRHYRRSDEVHHQRLWRPAELLAALRAADFRVRTLGGYGTLRFARGHRGFLAWKPR